MRKPNPIIFVHGVGASASIWKKIDILVRPVFYIWFADRFGHPTNQVFELSRFIDGILQKTNQEKVVLVCHSMGGLVARKYLADHPSNHNVEKIIFMGTPNLGVPLLRLNYFPSILIIAGLVLSIIFQNIYFILVAIIGISIEVGFYLRGIKLISKAVESIKANSSFLADLNSRKLPTDVEYVCLISRIFSGDGAVSVGSQRLSEKCVPNFSELNYKEIPINKPHFQEPQDVEAIRGALL